jgi:hypothetical protein
MRRREGNRKWFTLWITCCSSLKVKCLVFLCVSIRQEEKKREYHFLHLLLCSLPRFLLLELHAKDGNCGALILVGGAGCDRYMQ